MMNVWWHISKGCDLIQILLVWQKPWYERVKEVLNCVKKGTQTSPTLHCPRIICHFHFERNACRAMVTNGQNYDFFGSNHDMNLLKMQGYMGPFVVHMTWFIVVRILDCQWSLLMVPLKVLHLLLLCYHNNPNSWIILFFSTSEICFLLLSKHLVIASQGYGEIFCSTCFLHISISSSLDSLQ